MHSVVRQVAMGDTGFDVFNREAARHDDWSESRQGRCFSSRRYGVCRS